MDGQREAYVPVEERHQVSFGFYNLRPRGHYLGMFGAFKVLLHIWDKNKSVINLIEFWGNQKAGAQENGKGSAIHFGLTLGWQKVAVNQLTSYMDSFCALMESLAQSINPADDIISFVHVSFRNSSRIFTKLKAIVIVYLIWKHVVQDKHWRLIWTKDFILMFAHRVLYN